MSFHQNAVSVITLSQMGIPGEPGLDATYCPCPVRSIEMKMTQRMVDPAAEKKFSYDYYEDEATKRKKKSIIARRKWSRY